MKNPNRRSNYSRKWRESLPPSIMIRFITPCFQILLLRNGLIFRDMSSQYCTGHRTHLLDQRLRGLYWVKPVPCLPLRKGCWVVFSRPNSYTSTNDSKEFLERRTAFHTNTAHLWEPYNQAHHLQSGNSRGLLFTVVFSLNHSFAFFFFVVLYFSHFPQCPQDKVASKPSSSHLLPHLFSFFTSSLLEAATGQCSICTH